MNFVVLELGIRKFKISGEKAELIEKVLSHYKFNEMSRRWIIRHLIKLSLEDLIGFLRWCENGKPRTITPLSNNDNYLSWNNKFEEIVSQFNG